MLNKNPTTEKLQRDERQGKMLLHTEYSLLSLLEGEKGVIQQHGLFSVSTKRDLQFYDSKFKERKILKLLCILWSIGYGI